MKKLPGTVLIELLLALALLALIITPIMSTMGQTGRTQITLENRMSAENQLNVIAEAVWSVRNGGWDQLPSAGEYHAVKTDDGWSLATGSAVLQGHEQTITFQPVYRNSSWEMVDSSQIGEPGVMLDPSSKKVVVSIGYSDNFSKHITTQFVLTRYKDNEQLIQTTEADFEGGTFSGTFLTNTNGGEIILSGGGRGDWCNPNTNIATTYDLLGSGRASVIRAVEGQLFTGAESTDGQFIHLSVSQDDPPAVALLNSAAGYATNDLYFDSEYAYVASNGTAHDISILDLENMQVVGYYDDIWWSGEPRGIFVRGNVGYAVLGSRLHTFDLSTKTGQRPRLDEIQLSGWWSVSTEGYRLQVVGDYAFVAIGGPSRSGVGIADVTNASDIQLRGSINVDAGTPYDVIVNSLGNRAYYVTAQAGSKREFFVLNTSDKNSIARVGSYDSQGMNPRGISLVTGNRVLLVGTGGDEYQVIDITNEANPVKCGGLDIGSGAYGVAGVLEADGDAWAYVVTRDGSNELKVIEGGPGGVQYEDAGHFTSEAIDFVTQTVVNYIQFVHQDVTNTTVQYQVAGADPVEGSCDAAGYFFVGPDGTSNTFFSSEDTVPVNDDGMSYENPARCFKYRVFMSTQDETATPQFEEARISYSP